jgi:hypothetical protein
MDLRRSAFIRGEYEQRQYPRPSAYIRGPASRRAAYRSRKYSTVDTTRTVFTIWLSSVIPCA